MKIVIVGGGTAGWLAALMISKIKPEHTVTCIESSKIGIIGAGEGSTGALTNIIQNVMWDFGIDEQDFIKECDATIKLGIKHIGWGPDINKSYYGPIDGTPTGGQESDIIFQHALGYREQELLHLSTDLGYKIHHNKNSFVEHEGNHSYHFDAHKVGKYFKKVCTDVKHIDSEVKDVIIDSEQGWITSLNLTNGQTISGDMFIDASGFNRVLMNAVGGKWKSYKEQLPVNSALPFILPYEEDEIIRIRSIIMVERETQKGIIIGHQGSKLTEVGTEARKDIEEFIGKKVFLDLYVKVDKDWKEKDNKLGEYGYNG